MNAAATPEFSRPVDVASIGTDGGLHRIAADGAECLRLARRFALPSLQRLEAVVRLRRRAGGLIAAEGHLSARVTQACVVTLEPLESDVEADFTRTYSELPTARLAEQTVDPETEEHDPVENGRIDLGELVAEELALALDPYPRKPGAMFDFGQKSGGEDRE